MHYTKLISITPDAEKTMAYCARVSSKNQSNDNIAGLLSYCAKHGHWSVFELANMVLEVNTTRAISPQILRHRSFSFQELCMAGDSKIKLEGRPSVPIEYIYKMWHHGNKKHLWRKQRVKCFDEEKQEYIWANISDVFDTGIKPVYEYTDELGNTVACTKDHKVLTKQGFMPIGEAYSKQLVVARNGVPVWQDKQWMTQQVGLGLSQWEISQNAGCSSSTIKKWASRHGLSTKAQRAFKNIKCSIDLSFKQKVKRARDAFWQYADKPKTNCVHCGHNGSVSRLECSHIESVKARPDLAFDFNNMQVLCASCHTKYDYQVQGKTHSRQGTKLVKPKWVRLISEEFRANEQTYDLEIAHTSHNYVANGFCVHNSLRYANPAELEVPLPSLLKSAHDTDWRYQDTKNRQNSIEPTEAQHTELSKFTARFMDLAKEAQDLYDDLLEAGIAKECARGVLPMNQPCRLYMNGTVRSWIHYIKLRADSATQKEHRLIAESAKAIFAEQLPIVYQAVFN